MLGMRLADSLRVDRYQAAAQTTKKSQREWGGSRSVRPRSLGFLLAGELHAKEAIMPVADQS